MVQAATLLLFLTKWMVRVQLKRDVTRRRMGGEVKG